MDYNGHPDQCWGHVTYSQHFEDGMIVNLFEQLGIKKPSYLDIGAHHPTNISNTRLLYERGSRGVNVEVNPNLIEAFNKGRPEDTNVNIGCGPTAGIYPFYMYDDWSGRNTCSIEETKAVDMQVIKTIQVPVKTLNQIVIEYCCGLFPDFLSIDVEGLDYEILAYADFDDSCPSIICVEVRLKDSQKMKDMMRRKGFVSFCRMGENILFIHKNHEPWINSI